MKKDSMNKIINDSWGFAEARILNTCFKLKIFDKINDGNNTIEKLVHAYNYNPSIMKSMFFVLINKNILTFENNRYHINSDYFDFIVSTESKYIGNIWKTHEYLNNNLWNNLELFAKDESSKENLFAFEDNNHWKNILPYLNSLASNTSETISNYFPNNNIRVLDIGCGSAKLLSTLLEDHPNWVGVGIDNPSPIANATNNNIKLIEDGRLQLLTQDIFFYNKDIGEFDIVVLSNILHGYNKEQIIKLLNMVDKYLDSGGRLLINEFIIDENSEDIMQHIYNIQFSMTGNGKSFYLDDLDNLLNYCGYYYSKSIELDSPYNCILYSKNKPKL